MTSLSTVDLPNSFNMKFCSPPKAKAPTVRNTKISNVDIYRLIYYGRVLHLASLQMLKFNIQDTTAMNTNEYASERTNDDVSAAVSNYIQRLEVEDTHTKSKDDPTLVIQSSTNAFYNHVCPKAADTVTSPVLRLTIDDTPNRHSDIRCRICTS